ncbi:YHYH domain-containing protein [Pararhodobacter oceanensis]|uniref:YHYH domain-containing protein n=2 Tax=Pararhodobacter oceanensis TaxID=2172121 RepID=A0A2T8HP76_9RHOB|nr:YHYH domain-containing protein [Pararhodobacter oceanensis]
MRFILILAVVFLALASAALAHSGGLNAQGCHNNRRTGDYHCHRTQSSSLARTIRPANTARPSVRGSYRNCTEARAAGAAPVFRGDPGYGRHLDRDNDGIGCE